MSAGRVVLVVSSCLILGMAGLASTGILIPSLPFVMTAAGLYVALVLAGVLLPRMQMFGETLVQVPEAPAQIALTFDDGPHPSCTMRVLDLLKEEGARATFFVLGRRAEEFPALVQRIVAEGHELGLHTYTHPRSYAFLPPREVERDLRKCQQILQDLVGETVQWFRPPMGIASPRTFAGARLAQVEVVGWSVRGLDGRADTTKEQVLRRVSRGLRPGAIVLLHDRVELKSCGSEWISAGVLALPELLQEMRRRQLQSVTLSELVESAWGRESKKEAPDATCVSSSI